MAQRHEIEAWLGGNWSPEDTEQLVDKIIETGSDAEADWVRITLEHDQAPAEDQDDVVLQAASADYDRAGEVLDAARERLHAEIRAARERGMAVQAIAAAVGMSRQMIHRIVS